MTTSGFSFFLFQSAFAHCLTHSFRSPVFAGNPQCVNLQTGHSGRSGDESGTHSTLKDLAGTEGLVIKVVHCPKLLCFLFFISITISHSLPCWPHKFTDVYKLKCLVLVQPLFPDEMLWNSRGSRNFLLNPHLQPITKRNSFFFFNRHYLLGALSHLVLSASLPCLSKQS